MLVELFPSILRLINALCSDLSFTLVLHIISSFQAFHFSLTPVSATDLVVAFLNSFGQGIPKYVYIEVIAMPGPHGVAHTLELFLCFCD